MPSRRVSGSVVLLSGLSAWSLLLFGSLSLLISLLGGQLAGALVGLALVVHGGFELKLRPLLIANGNERAANRLAYNKLALSGSVVLYLLWQAVSIDPLEIEAMLARDPVRSLLTMTPSGTAEILRQDLPKVLLGAYGVAGVVVLLGCFGMAILYWRAASSKLEG